MVSDFSMILAVGNAEIRQSVSPKMEQSATDAGGVLEVAEKTPTGGAVDAESSVAKGVADSRSSEHASLSQQNLDSFALTNNQNPRSVDPFSTAGTVFNSRG